MEGQRRAGSGRGQGDAGRRALEQGVHLPVRCGRRALRCRAASAASRSTSSRCGLGIVDNTHEAGGDVPEAAHALWCPTLGAGWHWPPCGCATEACASWEPGARCCSDSPCRCSSAGGSAARAVWCGFRGGCTNLLDRGGKDGAGDARLRGSPVPAGCGATMQLCRRARARHAWPALPLRTIEMAALRSGRLCMTRVQRGAAACLGLLHAGRARPTLPAPEA
mmetsp:Transcript_13640/g.42709  ORF Transcript_13640/g.42709 Transcript_13640/m.42709 type:complete len:222 (+) Transcript_13640:316-981(+)